MEVLNQFDAINEGMEENTISTETTENTGVVLEEAEIIDCEADIEAVGDDENVQYQPQYQLCEVNRSDNAVAYRVVQVGEGHTEATELSLTTPINNTVQVLNNGQLYVLSNGTDVLTSETTRTVTPRVAKLQLKTPTNVSGGLKKRDERRRVTHNEVERRRRDKINSWIAKLGKLLPECEQVVNKEGDVKTNLEAQSKGGILARACEYITELREVQDNYAQSLDENGQLLEEAKTLRQLANQLRKENSELKAQIAVTAANTNYILGT